MKLHYLKFSVVTLLSTFLIVFPALSQSTSYKATINRFGGGQVGQTIQASTPNQLADKIYAVIRPSGNPLPTINVSLGTVSLSALQNTTRSKSISVQYLEYVRESIWIAKSPWKSINVSSIQSLSATYGVLLAKNGYRHRSSEPIPFKVTRGQNRNPTLHFDRSSESLVDAKLISYTVSAGSSGIKSNWLEAHFGRDSRLQAILIQEAERCRNQPPQQQQACLLPRYLIKLSRG